MVATGVVVVAAGAATIALAHSPWVAAHSPYDRAAGWLLLVPMWVLPACGFTLWWWRPSSPSGRVTLTLGAAWLAWLAAAPQHGLVAAWGADIAVVFRPLLFWLILGWPTGRLTRGDRRWVAVFFGLELLTWVAPDVLRPTIGPSEAKNPLLIVTLPHLADALFAMGTSVLLPVVGIVLIAAVVRRYEGTPLAARSSARPAVVAAAVAAAGDFVLVLSDYLGAVTYNVKGRTWLGGAIIAIDYLRYAIVPVIFVYAAWRARRSTPSTRIHTLDLGPARSPRRLQESVVLALGDPTARVAFHNAALGWVDLEGDPVEVDGPGRKVTFVERDGEPIAAVAYNALFEDRPRVVETAVAAAGLTVECERLEAEARSRTREATQARRTVVEVEDAARQRLERDLHDGAQQRLVGLALQAKLASQGIAAESTDEITEVLSQGVAAARHELHDVVTGLLPSVLAERGLGAALATMAATTPMAVNLDVRYPASIPPTVAATAWFAVAEAVANAVKHSDATTLHISGGVLDGTLWAEISDNGRGGAGLANGSGLANLSDRVDRARGHLTIRSRVGAGTDVHLALPIESPVGMPS